MKKQILGLILLTAFIASLMLVSAALVTPPVDSITFTSNGTATLTLTNATATQFNLTGYNSTLVFTDGTKNATITITGPALNTNLSSAQFTLSALFENNFMGTSTKTAYFNILNSSSSSQNETVQVSVTVSKGLCSDSNNGELVAKDLEFNILSGFGDDGDLFFYPLDKVEATFNLDNQGDFDIKNIEITACLLEIATGDCILDEGDMDLSDDSFDLDEGDDVDVTLTIEIDPDKLDGNDNSYALYVGATGEIVDDTDAGTYDGDSTCDSNSENIEIRTDDTFAVINNVIYTENVNCGDMLEISAEVFNVGDEDLEDDEVYFEIYNKELGINQEITFDDGIDSMSQESISFSTKMPSNISAKAYNIQLSVLDDHHNIMQNKEDDESQEIITVNVGKCTVVDTTSSVSITAELSEDTPKAVIGEQFVVESTIKNTGSSSVTYNVSVSGNSAWSEVSSIEPSTFTLASGESKKVSIYFNVDSDAKAGDKDFTIKVAYGSKTSEQKVAVTLEEGLTSSKILKNIKDNSFVYSIVLINLILLIAIIIVIVKMFGRKSED